MNKFLSITLMSCLIIVLLPLSQVNAATAPIQVKAESAVIIEASTGQVLYGMNENDARPPASMAKMMTEYLVMDAIGSGSLSWDDEVHISQYAGSIAGSGQLIAPGETYTVKKLFHTMSIFSGNDATVALAEKVGGTEGNFVNLMNDKAKEMGLSEHAHFVNATGLEMDYLKKTLAALGLADQVPNIPGQTLLTARDAASIAQRIILDYPEVLEIASITQELFNEDRENTLMNNNNRMLEDWNQQEDYSAAFAYPGLDGLKTGFTDPAGYCFTGTAVKGDLRLITVVMGTESSDQRFIETKKLLDYGLNQFEKETLVIAKSATDLVENVPVKKGLEKQVAIITESGVELFVNKDDPEEKFKYSIEMMDEEDIIAPIQRGDVLGTLTMTYDSPMGIIEKNVNLIAADDVEKAGWFRLFFRGVGEFFGNLFENIKGLF